MDSFCRLLLLWIHSSDYYGLILQIIDNKESALGFRSDSPWKDFSFFCGYGGLVVEATREIQSQPILYKVCAPSSQLIDFY